LQKIKGRSKSSKSILCLSDIHCGSIFAPCSSEPLITANDSRLNTTWNPSELQKQMTGFWEWSRDQLTQKPFLTLINGEPIDGDNPKELGGPTWSSNVQDQINDFLKLMKIFPKPQAFTMTRGSGYHILKGNTSFEDQVAKLLGVEPYESRRDVEKKRIWNESRNSEIVIDDVVNFEINGAIINAAHHIGYNRSYHSKSQAVTAMLAELEFARGKYWEPGEFPDIFLRGHVHYFVEVRFARVRGVTQACYKLSADRFMSRKGVPDPASIGNLEVIIEPNGHIAVEPHIITNEMYPKYDIQRYE